MNMLQKKKKKKVKLTEKKKKVKKTKKMMEKKDSKTTVQIRITKTVSLLLQNIYLVKFDIPQYMKYLFEKTQT